MVQQCEDRGDNCYCCRPRGLTTVASNTVASNSVASNTVASDTVASASAKQSQDEDDESETNLLGSDKF